MTSQHNVTPLLSKKIMLLTQRSLKSRFRAIWTSIVLNTPPEFGDRLKALLKAVIHDSLPKLELVNELDLTIVAIAIGVYWHQDLQDVRSRILDLQSHSKADIQEFVLAYVIASGCRGELQPQSLINQIRHELRQRQSLSRYPASQQKYLAQLELVQKLVNTGASAIAAHRSNGLSEALASSLYYFLSTPHSWQIIVTRTQSHNLQIAVQSGAIAAAYLGEISKVISSDPQNHEILSQGSRLGEQLWWEWAGCYSIIPN